MQKPAETRRALSFTEVTLSLTDAERLRAAGHTVKLEGHGELPLVFDLAAWLELEQRIGSILEVNRRITWHGNLMNDVLHFLTAGLLHSGLGEEEVRGSILLLEMPDYQQAIIQALAESLPKPEGASGTSSTTSPLSDTAEVMASSGA
jgi:hypothetical protein